MSHPAAELRPARADDAPALAGFAAQAFTDTYRGLDDDQDIADYCAEHFTPAVMAAVIADPACTTMLALVGDALAGYAIVRDKPAPPCVAGRAVQLWRLYLGQAFIGQRLGATLMTAAQAEARRRGAETLWPGALASCRWAPASSCSAAASTPTRSTPQLSRSWRRPDVLQPAS
jgi:diamine N-acetyltransferase